MDSVDFSYFESRVPIIRELGFNSDRLAELRLYIESLCKANLELNLFSRKMLFSELIDNHIIDCLLPLKSFPLNVRTMADFGSGGGLPAIIYAIHFPQTKFILFEKSPKKQIFLNSLKPIVPNVQVFGEIPLKLKNIDLITARAFKPIDVILDISRSYYEEGGQYFLFKGRKEKIDEEIVIAQKKFKEMKSKIIELKSPIMEVERNLVLI